ncbi:MAG TPA: hypothetical protein VJ001_07945 [Rhodocyclaceae bacterium]|nr:hypothetical protein [Rhodocyclaceae bacterium]
MKYLLDTNVLIHLQKRKLAHDLPVGAYAYSVVSEIELLSWPQMQPEHELVWRGLLAPLHRVELNVAVRETAIRLRRERRLKLPDATLLTNDLQLLALPTVRCQSLELKHD